MVENISSGQTVKTCMLCYGTKEIANEIGETVPCPYCNEIPDDEELFDKADIKIKKSLRNLENLSEEEQHKTTEAIVLRSMLKNWDKFTDALLDTAVSIKTGKCVRCKLPFPTGTCEICETVRRVQNNSSSTTKTGTDNVKSSQIGIDIQDG